MNILAIESSSNYGSIALLNNSNIIFERFFSAKEFKTEKLTTYLKDILKQLDITINHIDYFAVSLGPGSYTALRIGLTTVRTISQVTNKPLICISTLETIAAQALPLNVALIVVTKARQDILNIALFGLDIDTIIPLTGDFIINKRTLIQNLSKIKGIIYLSGDLSNEVFNEAKDINKHTIIRVIPELFHLPKASTLGYLAYKKILNNDINNSFELKINYAFQPHVIISDKNDPNKKS